MRPVKLKRNIVEEMFRHAREEWPLECCGLLSGYSGVISKIQRMSNALKSSDKFFMEPVELIEFFKSLRDAESEHLGIYHSHPFSEAIPSRRDREESGYPRCPFFIVSLKSFEAPLLKAFSLKEDPALEWPLEILD